MAAEARKGQVSKLGEVGLLPSLHGDLSVLFRSCGYQSCGTAEEKKPLASSGSLGSFVASGNPLEWETAWPVPGLPGAEQELASVRQQTCAPGGF